MIFKVTELPARLFAVPVQTLPQFPDQYFLVIADRYFKHFTVILKILKIPVMPRREKPRRAHQNYYKKEAYCSQDTLDEIQTVNTADGLLLRFQIVLFPLHT